MNVVRAWELTESGEAVLVDVRDQSKFGLGHPRCALNLPFSLRGLEERLGMLLQPGTSVVLITENSEQAEAALPQFQEGAFNVLGVVEGGIDAWQESDLPWEVLRELSVHDISGAAADGNTVIVDVRESIEWDMGHVPDAILISLGELRERIDEIPREQRVAVICEAGVRSSSAASILQAAGFPDVVNVPEGTGGYRNAGLPLETPDQELS